MQLQQNHRGLRRAVVKARLNDICPADSYGAYLQVRAYYPSSSSVAYSSGDAKDVRGCPAGAKDVVVRTGWVADPYKITVRLYEYDADTGDIANADAASVEFTPNQFRR